MKPCYQVVQYCHANQQFDTTVFTVYKNIWDVRYRARQSQATQGMQR